MIKVLTFLWSLTALVFGIQLYFSNNQNLDNPDVNPMVPLAKDIVWACVVTLLSASAIFKRRLHVPGPIRMILISNCILSATLLVVLYLLYKGINPYYLSFFKNMILYGTVSYFFVSVLSSCESSGLLLRYTHFAITVSLFIGILLHIFYEVKSETGRMFGCIGNPNGVGCMSVLNVALMYALIPKRRFLLRLVAMVISVISLAFSGSLSAFFGLALFVVLDHLFRKWYIGQVRVLTGLAVFVIGSILAVWAANMVSVESQLETRLLSLVQMKESDSLNVRIYDTSETLAVQDIGLIALGRLPPDYLKYDSSLVGFFYNFGIIGLIGFTLPLAIAIHSIIKVRTQVPDKQQLEILTSLASGLVAVLITNLPTQYQFDVFPTNYVLSVMSATIIVMTQKKGEAL